VHCDREHEQRDGRGRERRRAFDLRDSPPEEGGEQQGRDAGAERDPRQRRGSALVRPVGQPEIAGKRLLERDPCDERDRQDRPAQQSGEHERPADEDEVPRREAHDPARLRDRDRVGEVREDERQQGDREGDEHRPEHEGAPHPPEREESQRKERERGDRDHPRAAEELRRQPVAVQPEDVELQAVVREGPAHLCVRGIVRDGLAHDREQPEDNQPRRHEDRRQGRPDVGDVVANVEDRAHEQEADEPRGDEHRVARMDERHRRRCGRDRGDERPGGVADVGEDECQQRRQQQRPRGSRRKRERRVRTSVPGSEPQERELHDRRRDACPARAEEREAGLVGEQERKRQQHGRGVQHDRWRADACEPRHDRDRRVPERERVARMQPAVAELVHRPQRERVEAEQLLLPGQVEERVAVVARDPPERDPGDRSEREHAQAPGRDPAGAGCGERCGHDRNDREQGNRQPERRVHREHHRSGAEERTHAPGEGRRETAQPERPRHQRARQEQARNRWRKAKSESEPVRRQEPREGEQRRRRQPRERQRARGQAQSEAGGDRAHRLRRRATWTSAGLRSSRAKTAST